MKTAILFVSLLIASASTAFANPEADAVLQKAMQGKVLECQLVNLNPIEFSFSFKNSVLTVDGKGSLGGNYSIKETLIKNGKLMISLNNPGAPASQYDYVWMSVAKLERLSQGVISVIPVMNQDHDFYLDETFTHQMQCFLETRT
jgi:hypothetical protein